MAEFLVNFNNLPDIGVCSKPLCELYVDSSLGEQAMGIGKVLKSSS